MISERNLVKFINIDYDNKIELLPDGYQRADRERERERDHIDHKPTLQICI